MISRPGENEFAPYYLRYISLIHEEDVLPVLHSQIADLIKWVTNITPDQERYRYAPGKWSIREVIGHIIDGERVFGYRAFCFSRKEAAVLPIFDENKYVEMAQYGEQPLIDLVHEFGLVRQSNLFFLSPLPEATYEQAGLVGNNAISVRALAYIMAGHVCHHMNVLRESYGISVGA
jgi:hypothetical protein